MQLSRFRREGFESLGRELEFSLRTVINGQESVQSGTVCKAMLNGRKYPKFYAENRRTKAGIKKQVEYKLADGLVVEEMEIQ
jgi:hypothetical protein